MKKTLLFLAVLLPVTLVKAQTLPNGNFENWTVTPFEDLVTWSTSNPFFIPEFGITNVTKVSGVSNTAVRLETVAVGTDTLPGVIWNFEGDDPFENVGGVPFSQKPTTLTGDFRYNVLTGDTAFIFVRFVNDTVYSEDTIKITGNQSTFTAMNFSLHNIIASTIIPDSVIIIASSGNFDFVNMKNGTFLEMDNLQLTGPGVTQTIDGTFDAWAMDTITTPDDWDIAGEVERTTDKFEGSYAAQLVSVDFDGFVEAGEISASIPLNQTIDTLTGYYKYTTPGTDEGTANIVLFDNNGNFITDINHSFAPASGYTYFEIPIFSNPAPSSAIIFFTSSDWSSSPVAGSTLKLDSLTIVPEFLSVETVKADNDFTVYPNPAVDLLNIQFHKHLQGAKQVMIYDVEGRVVFNKEYNTPATLLSIPVKQLPQGMYSFEVTEDGIVSRGKFLKQ